MLLKIGLQKRRGTLGKAYVHGMRDGGISDCPCVARVILSRHLRNTVEWIGVPQW